MGKIVRLVWDLATGKYKEEVRDYSGTSFMQQNGIEVPINIPDVNQPVTGTGYKANPYALPQQPTKTDKLTQEKNVPDNLTTLISNREKVGASIFVIKRQKPQNVWSYTHRTNKFFLTRLVMSSKEKVQVLDTFGSATISFFGESIKVYELSGVTIESPSSQDDYTLTTTVEQRGRIRTNVRTLDETSGEEGYTYNSQGILSRTAVGAFWQSSLIHMYNNVLRGTQLVKNDSMALLTVGTHFIYGYPLNMVSDYTSQAEGIASFSMSWLVLDHILSYEELDQDDFATNYELNDSIPLDGATASPIITVTA